MRLLLVIVLLVLGYLYNISNSIAQYPTQTFARAPDYCVGFASDACERIRSVVESRIRPSFCVPGFARLDNRIQLTPEQLRICFAMPEPISPEEQRQFNAEEARQKQRIEDARAMVRDSWSNYASSVEAIEVGCKCDVFDQTSGEVAIRRIHVAMSDELNHAGLIGDRTMNIQQVISASIEAGKISVQNGACSRLTPAMRGRLRAMVSATAQ